MKKNKGFTLIEILLVFALSIVILTGAFFLYKKVKIENQSSNIVSEMLSVKSQSSTLFKQMNSMGGNASASLLSFVKSQCGATYFTMGAISNGGKISDQYSKLKNNCYNKLGIKTGSLTSMGNVYITISIGQYNIDSPTVSVYGIKDVDLCMSVIKKFYAMSTRRTQSEELDYSAQYRNNDDLIVGNSSVYSSMYRTSRYNTSNVLTSMTSKCQEFNESSRTDNFIAFGPSS